MEDFGVDVEVQGMAVSDGDLIHADQHGAVVIPHHAAEAVLDAAAVMAERESFIIEAARKPGFSVGDFEAALLKAAKVHYPR